VKYAALLFDLDGTLVDSIPLWKEATLAALAEAHITMSPDQFDALYREDVIIRIWLAQKGYAEDFIDAIRASRDAMYLKNLAERCPWFPGAEELLQSLAGRYPMALITNSHRAYVDAIQQRLPLDRFFPLTITEDDMGGFRKPHPHSLFLATDALKVDPARCLCVGDRLLDVEFAHAGGAHGCIVPGTYTTTEAMEQADLVVPSLTELGAAAGLS